MFGFFRPKTVKASSPCIAPLGFNIFAMKYPKEVSNADWETDTVSLTDSQLVTLNRINRVINRSIQPRLDKQDEWSLNPPQGDCEDYAVTKRHFLRNSGIPAGALRLAAVITHWGETHCVLICRTTKGDLVLDNLTNEILRWDKTRHRLIMMSTSKPTIWVKP